MACSPLVSDGLVIVTIGSPSATVVACDLKTGETKWTAGQGEKAGYSSPSVLKIGGKDQLVVFAGASAFGVDPASGKQLWKYAYVTDYDCNIATPLAVGGNVLISAGENHGSALLKIGSNSTVSEVWTSIGTGSVLRNEWQTSIQSGGHLYGFDNVGSAGPVTHLTCVKAATGERVWRQLRFGKGNLIAADGKLFASTMKGEVVIVSATPDGFQELGRQTVLGRTRQAPTLADGRLYLRDDEVIVCLDVRGKK
jgi:outer membrane protein assembly factor BamB